MSAYSHSKDPTNDYLLITAKTGWDALRLCDSMSEQAFLNKLQQ
jgi:hypothetical protein